MQLKHAKIQNKTRHGLVALYVIRPGNGAGLILQPKRTHGAYSLTKLMTCNLYYHASQMQLLHYKGIYTSLDTTTLKHCR